MTLPKVSTPTYEMKIPSTGKVYKFRPFLVKEQKLLLMALESKDPVQMQSSMSDIIRLCFFEKLDPSELAPYDLELIFLKLRAKSVGEISKLSFACTKTVDKPIFITDEEGNRVQQGTKEAECGGKIEIEVNLEELTIDTSTMKPNKVVVGTNDNGEVGVILRIPTIASMMKYDGNNPKVTDTEVAFSLLADCIEMIYNGEETFHRNDLDREEVLDFIGTLPAEKFAEIMEFIASVPKLSKTVDLKCPSCGNETKYTIEGIDGFFD